MLFVAVNAADERRRANERQRMATVGYYVLLPNLYYRSQVEEFGPFVGNASVREKFMKLMAGLTIPMIMDDTDALIAFAAGDAAASNGPLGCVGYCMSGQYALNAAARHPDRAAAAAERHWERLFSLFAGAIPHTR